MKVKLLSLSIYCMIALTVLGDCAENITYDSTRGKQLLWPSRCGFSNAAHARIVGGKPSAIGSWPWIALLGPRGRNNQVFFKCGGSLISARHVLTAAHCMDENRPYLVRLGEHNVNSNSDGAHPIDVPVVNRAVHASYNYETYENDIALLSLGEVVNFTPKIHPICLPWTDSIRTQNFVGKYLFVAGWGATKFEGPTSSIVREVQVQVVSQNRCAWLYREINSVVDARTLCAGHPRGGKDSCQGDSGGPLMLPNKNTWYLIGVVSSGFECARRNYPGIYTRITAFLPWIRSHVE